MSERASAVLSAGPSPSPELTGRQKAAALIVALGVDLASRVLRHLGDNDIEAVMTEVANSNRVPADTQKRVAQEFLQTVLAHEFYQQGGLEYARSALDRALGTQRAGGIIQRLLASSQVRPFGFARRSDPVGLSNFLQGEHPQTVALVLAHLLPEQAAAVLGGLPPDLRVDVARRVALMDRASPEVVREVEQVLERKLATNAMLEDARAGGLSTLVQILNRVDRGTEKSIIETLADQDPELADQIKKQLFVFEDIVNLDSRSLQRVLREVDLSRVLPLSLKVASDELKAKIAQNLSERAAQNLKEDMEFLGPVRLREVEEAQQTIVAIVRRLDEEGEIILSRGGGEDIVV
ncbi:MAG: flagellar motor switch protein FliG [bacterium]|nr:flagellar motor switch protein FliG [bacterium]